MPDAPVSTAPVPSAPVSSAPVPGADTTAPTVTARAPAGGATGVGTSTSVKATFDEAVEGADAGTFTLKDALGATVPAGVTYDATGSVATLQPSAGLAPGATYTATLTGGPAAIRDAAGNPLATTSWAFTTDPPPTVTARTPASGATGFSRTANITATFSEAVTAVSASTFTVRKRSGEAAYAATVSRNGTTNQWILNPSATLPSKTQFTVTLTGGASAIRDAVGNPLVTTSWHFTSGS